MKKTLLTLLIMALSIITIKAQKEVKNVIEINFNNIQAIKNGEKITGYYMFYKEDKLKGKDYAYRLLILDENTEEVARKSLVASESFKLLESGYNQGILCFKFYDVKEHTYSLIFYDNEANNINTVKYEAKKIEKKMMEYYLQSNIKAQPTLFPVNNLGFLDYRMVRNKSDGYIVTYYPNDPKQKGWVFKSSETSEDQEYINNLSTNGNIVTNIVSKRATRLSKDFTSSILVIDLNTGKEIYRKPVSSAKYEIMYFNSLYDEEKKELTLIGNYYEKGKNVMNAEILGLAFAKLDEKGNEIEKKIISWADDVDKLLPAGKKGKFKDIGYIYFHRFIQADDKKFYGIGESYNNNGGTKVKDIYVFEFDSSFEPSSVKVFEKEETKIDLGVNGSVVSGYLINALNGFEVSYIKELANQDGFIIFYQDYDKKKKEKNKSICGVVAYTNGVYTEDKIEVDTEADYVKVLPAEGSNVLFLEYFKKEHDIQMNMKKMNY